MKNLLRVFSFIAAFWAIEVSFAQEPTAEDEGSQKFAVENVVAFVQYVDGDVELDEPEWREKELSYKRLLYFGDSFSVPSGDLIKLVTIQGCTVVLYGPIKMRMPVEAGASWGVDDGVFRWVCPKGKTQKVKVRGQSIEIFEAELFVNRDQLMFFEGAGKIENSVVVADVLHRYRDKWEFANLNYDLKELKEDWDDDFPVPREVRRTEIENEALDEYSWHFGAGPSFGYGTIQLTAEIDEALDRGTGGGLFWLAKDFDTFTLLSSINIIDMESVDEPLVGDYRDEYVDLRFRSNLFSIGMMKPASESFSYFGAIGVGVSELEVSESDDRNTTNGYRFSRHEHTVVGLTGGAMKRFFDRSTFYGWASLSATFLYGSYTATYEGSSDSVPDYYGALLTLSLGPGFQL